MYIHVSVYMSIYILYFPTILYTLVFFAWSILEIILYQQIKCLLILSYDYIVFHSMAYYNLPYLIGIPLDGKLGTFQSFASIIKQLQLITLFMSFHTCVRTSVE